MLDNVYIVSPPLQLQPYHHNLIPGLRLLIQLLWQDSIPQIRPQITTCHPKTHHCYIYITVFEKKPSDIYTMQNKHVYKFGDQ